MKYLQTLILAALMTSPAPLHATAADGIDASQLTAELQRAASLLERHRYEDAIRLLVEQAESPSTSFEALWLLASAHLGLGQYSEALAAADSMLEVAASPDRTARALSFLGLALFQKSVSEDRKFHSSGNRLDRILEVLKSLERSRDPRPSLGRLRDGKDDFKSSQETLLEEAAAAFRQAIELGGDSAVLDRYRLAEVLAQLGRLDEARIELARYFELADAAEVPLGPEELRCHLDSLDSGVLNRSTEGLVPPRSSDRKSAKYTAKALRRKIEGSVFLKGVIDAEGKVRCLRPLRGLPLGLTRQAMKAVRGSSFEPARLEGEPVTVNYAFTVNFRAGYGSFPSAAEIQRQRRTYAQW